MRPVDAQAKIREIAAVPCDRHDPKDRGRLDPSQSLDCELLASKLKEYSRFGLPGGHGDGRGGEAPLPMLGTTDRQILLARDNYQKFLTDAALALEAAMRIQRAWVVPRVDDTEKEKQLKDEKRVGAPCKNVWCDHWMTGFGNDRPRDGRCMACNQHWKRHGTERRVTSEVTGGDAA